MFSAEMTKKNHHPITGKHRLYGWRHAFKSTFAGPSTVYNRKHFFLFNLFLIYYSCRIYYITVYTKGVKMASVFEYSDYRQFLRDYYEQHKAVNPSFSYRYLSQKAGINSAPFFKFIIEGKRNLTKATILKTCVGLKLSDREAEYFENLVFFNQGKTIAEKNYYFERLVETQRHRSVAKIREDQFEYFTEWYHCVIREAVCMIDFKEDYAMLAKFLHPPITSKEAAKSVKLLLNLGFLKKVDNRYYQSDPVLSTGYGLVSHQLINFQIMMLNKAIVAFDHCKKEERLTSATTIAVSRQTYDKMVRKLRAVRAELLELARCDTDPERVYELTINLFPLTVTGKKL